MSVDFYTMMTGRRRAWDVITPAPNSEVAVEGAEEVIKRCLAIRSLEISVQDWIEQAASKELGKLPQSAIDLFLLNATDEIKHDKQLDILANTYSVTAADDAKATHLVQAWKDHSATDKDHSIVMAATIETSVFFVLLPLLRFGGGISARVVSGEISNDESIHSAANRQASKDLGYEPSDALKKLRRDTVAYLVETLRIPAAGKKGKPEYWITQSDKLLELGVSDMEETKKARYIAFFEVSGQKIPKYS